MRDERRGSPAAPVIAIAPARERTVLGVGPAARPEPGRPRPVMPSAPEPPPEDGWDVASKGEEEAKTESPAVPERSLPIALVTAKREVASPSPPSEASLAAAGVPRRRSRWWAAILVILVAAGCAAYVQRDRSPWVHSLIERVSAIFSAHH
jgi:hypothetical protein